MDFHLWYVLQIIIIVLRHHGNILFVKYGHWSRKKHSIKLGALQPIQNLELPHIYFQQVNTCWKTRAITEILFLWPYIRRAKRDVNNRNWKTKNLYLEYFYLAWLNWCHIHWLKKKNQTPEEETEFKSNSIIFKCICVPGSDYLGWILALIFCLCNFNKLPNPSHLPIHIFPLKWGEQWCCAHYYRAIMRTRWRQFI